MLRNMFHLVSFRGCIGRKVYAWYMLALALLMAASYGLVGMATVHLAEEDLRRSETVRNAAMASVAESEKVQKNVEEVLARVEALKAGKPMPAPAANEEPTENVVTETSAQRHDRYLKEMQEDQKHSNKLLSVMVMYIVFMVMQMILAFSAASRRLQDANRRGIEALPLLPLIVFIPWAGLAAMLLLFLLPSRHENNKFLNQK